MRRYRLRSSEVDALPFEPGLEDEWAHLWRDGVLVGGYATREEADACPEKVSPGYFGDTVPVIATAKGRVAVYAGDWIVSNDLGERSVVQGNVFDQLYEVATHKP